MEFSEFDSKYKNLLKKTSICSKPQSIVLYKQKLLSPKEEEKKKIVEHMKAEAHRNKVEERSREVK